MIKGVPNLSSLSQKIRAKHYEPLRNIQQTDGTAVRGRKYRPKKLAQQKASQKGPTMKRRNKRYKSTPSALHPYASNFEFSLRIENYTIHCSKISNLSQSVEVEEVAEGGNNNFPNVFAAAAKKTDTLVIERALVEDKIMSEFAVGVHVGECTISILRNGVIYKELGFDEGMITKWELNNLEAMGHEISTHKLEIKHSGLYSW